MCHGAAVPGPNSTRLMTLSWTWRSWPSRSLRTICVSFGPAGACALATFGIAEADAATPARSKKLRRRIFMVCPPWIDAFRPEQAMASMRLLAKTRDCPTIPRLLRARQANETAAKAELKPLSRSYRQALKRIFAPPSIRFRAAAHRVVILEGCRRQDAGLTCLGEIAGSPSDGIRPSAAQRSIGRAIAHGWNFAFALGLSDLCASPRLRRHGLL